MSLKAAMGIVATEFLFVCLSVSSALQAQNSGLVLSGTVATSSGAPVPNPSVSVKNVTTGQSTQTQTDSAGHYALSNLVPGDYQVSASAEGVGAGTGKVTLTAGKSQAFDLVLTTRAITSSEPTLEDLGISSTQAQGSPQDQARLNKRSHMLMLHQRLPRRVVRGVHMMRLKLGAAPQQ
jgi:Carboxypeptidase regulatory-like domain